MRLRTSRSFLNHILLKHILRFEVWVGLRALKRHVESRSPFAAALDGGTSQAP